MLTSEEKRQLLGIARDAIERVLFNKEAVRWDAVDEALLKPRSAFVTLRIGGHLRGCIGYIESPKPLAQIVAEVAEKAAFEDPRFPPLNLAEYQQAYIEISILSEFRPVTTPDEVIVGTHGLLLETGAQRGLLLPQVAAEFGWDRSAFLDAVARKAGLPAFPWDDPETKLYIFDAEIVTDPVEA